MRGAPACRGREQGMANQFNSIPIQFKFASIEAPAVEIHFAGMILDLSKTAPLL
jgi:hypothetical protein